MERIERVEEKMDVVIEKQGEMAVSLAELAVATQSNTESLKQHMEQTLETRKQTQVLYEGIQLLKREIDARDRVYQETLNNRLHPTEQFVDRAKFLGILLGLVASCALAIIKSGLVNALLHIH